MSSVKGYRQLDENEIAAMNRLKELEAQVAKAFSDVAANGLDGESARMLATARTHIQTGFMWANRSIAKPLDPFVDGEWYA